MGFLMSKSMDENMKKQQEFMLHNSRLQLERQIIMQNQMRERQMAMQIAWSREFLKYYGAFFSLATLGLTVGAIKRQKPGLFVPVVPLSFIMAYQMDMAYGTLVSRMKGASHTSPLLYYLYLMCWMLMLWDNQYCAKVYFLNVNLFIYLFILRS
uniref:Plasminogen receptor (KT) n=1 Tax=Denticeps clupeoides TaxID=299321 RepID=A0AAY4DW68_9TELE